MQPQTMINSKSDWDKAKNLLCIRLDAMGDILMTTPAMRALKRNRPDRRITLLTSGSGAKIAPLIPEVDAKMIYESPWMKATRPGMNSNLDFKIIDRLHWGGFDAAIIFTVFSQNPLPAAYMAYLAEIPLRLAHCRENPYLLLTDWVPEQDHFDQPGIRHEVQRQLDLVAAIGCNTENERLSLKVPKIDTHKVVERLLDMGLSMHEPWVIIHPGASAPSRRYPAQSFARVAQKLCSEFGFQVVFTGNKSEIELVDEIRSDMKPTSFTLAGALDIKEFAALISLAPLLISNNTGPVHIAAAVGTPVVDIYALTNPQHTPWQVPNRVLFHDVPCKFCYKSVCPMGHHDCLRMIPPDAVVQSALDLLGEQAHLNNESLRIQRIGWVVLTLIVLAALLGLLCGISPTLSRESPNYL